MPTVWLSIIAFLSVVLLIQLVSARAKAKAVHVPKQAIESVTEWSLLQAVQKSMRRSIKITSGCVTSSWKQLLFNIIKPLKPGVGTHSRCRYGHIGTLASFFTSAISSIAAQKQAVASVPCQQLHASLFGLVLQEQPQAHPHVPVPCMLRYPTSQSREV
jgi:hypothetical protein